MTRQRAIKRGDGGMREVKRERGWGKGYTEKGGRREGKIQEGTNEGGKGEKEMRRSEKKQGRDEIWKKGKHNVV